jgi:hypothetical protein
VTLAEDPVFYLKLSLLMIAILNAFIFHRFVFRPEGAWNATTNIPFGAKVNAVLSILLWLMIISCGRLLAY